MEKVNRVSGKKILRDLQEFRDGEADLADRMEELRRLPGPDDEGIRYDSGIYHGSANAAGIADFIITQAIARGMEDFEYELSQPLEIANGFEQAMSYFTDQLTSRKVLIDEISPDQLRTVLLESVERQISQGRELRAVFGYTPGDSELNRIENENVRCFGILARFIKEALA